MGNKKRSLNVIEDYNVTIGDKRFVHEYIKDYNAVQAELRVNPQKSYSSAASYSRKRLLRPKVRDYLAHVERNYARECGLSKYKVVKEQMAIAFSNIADVYKTWQDLKDFDTLTDEQKSAIAEIDTRIITKLSKDGEPYETKYVKIRMHDKMKAMENLAKLLGMNEPEKIEAKVASISLVLSNPELMDKLNAEGALKNNKI